jgi:hypothetical protein
MTKQLKIIEPDYDYLMKMAHRRWIETRDPKDGDKFAEIVQVAVRAALHQKGGE